MLGCAVSRRVEYFIKVCKQTVIRDALKFAVPSSIWAALLKITDSDLELDFLSRRVPDEKVYTTFAATVSLLLVFRTVQSLNMYREGARSAYHMAGAWYDSASTLISFCRNATAEPNAVINFKHTLVRLFSLLSMLCLTELENSEDAQGSHAMKFNVIDADGLDEATLQHIKLSRCKADIVCQMIQCLVVENIGTGVLNVPPPILSRSFQDLGSGMLKFHETINLSRVPLPFPLLAITEILLFIHAFLAPFWMAVWTQDAPTAAVATFIQVFVLCTLNGVACEVETPFSGDANDVDIENIHYDMNIRLLALVNLSDSFCAATRIKSHDVLAAVDVLERQAGRKMCTRKQREITKKHEKINAMNAFFDDLMDRSSLRCETPKTMTALASMKEEIDLKPPPSSGASDGIDENKRDGQRPGTSSCTPAIPAVAVHQQHPRFTSWTPGNRGNSLGNKAADGQSLALSVPVNLNANKDVRSKDVSTLKSLTEPVEL